MHDPDLTPLGEEQCHQLAAAFPYHKSIDLLVASPLRRTISTALLAFDQEVKRGMHVIALPTAQETSALPSDTGSDADVLRKEMAGKPVDLSHVHEGWNSKAGKWAAEAGALERRAKETRQWLQARPEREIVLVAHGGILHYLSEDWSDSGRFNGAPTLRRTPVQPNWKVHVTVSDRHSNGSGTGWANAEFRTYRFPNPDDENASLEETSESRERRRGTEKPLSKTERMDLRQTTQKNWEQDGFQVQSKA